MTARQTRRAAERKARKLARKEFAGMETGYPAPIVQPAFGLIDDRLQPIACDPSSSVVEDIPVENVPSESKVSSPARVAAANRQNAQLSTGPKTAEGKATSSLNAVRTGLTGRTILLPSEDAAAYQAHVQSFVARYSPQTGEEKTLIQQLADTEWRLLRIPSLELGIYAVGRLELASNFQSEADPAVRSALLDAKVFLTFQRQLNNLSIQESRLLKLREKTQVELGRLLQYRLRERSAVLDAPAVGPKPDTGFEFLGHSRPGCTTAAQSESSFPAASLRPS